MNKFLIILLSLSIFSCTENIKDDVGLILLTKPEKVHRNKEIKIILNVSKDSKKDTFFAKVISFNSDGNHSQYRLPFARKKLKLVTKFLVPYNSCFLKIDYEKKNENKKQESIFRIVYEKNKPSLTGVVLSLKNSKNLNELDTILSYNEILYPNNKLSWGMAFFIKKKFLNLNNIDNQVDSIYNLVKQIRKKISKDDLFDNLSACFMGFCLTRNWSKVNIILNQMKKEKFQQIKPSGLAIENIIQFLRENSIKSFITNEAITITGNTEEIYRKLFSWPMINNTRLFRNGSLKRLDSITTVNKLFRPFINQVTTLYLNDDKKINTYEITNYFYLTNILKWEKDYTKAIAVGLKGKEILEKFLLIDFWDKNNVIEGVLSSNLGLYGALINEIAHCAMLDNNDSLAISLYNRLINLKTDNEDNQFIIGAQSLAAIYLTNIYIRLKQFKNATKILRKAYKLKSPYADETFKHLQESLLSSTNDTLVFKDFINNSFTLYPPAPDFTLSYQNKSYNINGNNCLLTFIFFLSGSCKSCDDPVLNAIDILNSYKKVNKNIVIVADKELLQFFKESYSNIFTFQINKEILRKFNIKELPSSVVVKDGKIIDKNPYITKNINAWKYYLGIR